MRSSPNSSGHGLSEATQSVAEPASAAEGLELTPVAGKLFALGLDHLGGCPLEEALIGEHALRARDLLPKAFDFGRRVTVADDLSPLDGLEDPPFVLAQLREHAAP